MSAALKVEKNNRRDEVEWVYHVPLPGSRVTPLAGPSLPDLFIKK